MSTHAEDQINKIHEILNEYDGEEALRRIREVMYGGIPTEEDEKDDTKEESGK